MPRLCQQLLGVMRDCIASKAVLEPTRLQEAAQCALRLRSPRVKDRQVVERDGLRGLGGRGALHIYTQMAVCWRASLQLARSASHAQRNLQILKGSVERVALALPRAAVP